MEKPWEPAPFKFAVFLSSIYPYSAKTSEGIDVTNIIPVNERLDQSDSETGSSTDEDPADALCRRLTPQSCNAKISIPTAHIYGDSDPLKPESTDVIEMCDPMMRSTFVHQGAHDIPLEYETSQHIHDTIQKAIERSNMIS